jgi:hypothetical protein
LYFLNLVGCIQYHFKGWRKTGEPGEKPPILFYFPYHTPASAFLLLLLLLSS